MKTTKHLIEASAPASVRPSSVSKTKALPRIDFRLRHRNRQLPTPKVLDLLVATLPEAYDMAEVVGKWIWVQFAEVPAVGIRRQLSELGFHWNNVRQAWQHPCGIYRDRRIAYDPRQRYGSYFPADQKPA